jgi:ribosomal protein L21
MKGEVEVEVEVDEVFIVGYEKWKVGRCDEKKALVAATVKKYGSTGIVRMYAISIPNARTVN